VATYRIDLAYNGSGFHGYARQPSVRTVQGVLEGALFRSVDPVETTVAGRTDKGVHARAQVVSFSAGADLDTVRLVRSLNRQLAPEIAIRRIERVADGFSARFDATERAYTYLVLNRDTPDPFLAPFCWQYPTPLDLDRMNVAAGHFIGEHDFASLCRKAGDRSTVRLVRRAAWSPRDDDLLAFDVAASSFCHQMVRSMVALCAEVGRGRVDPSAVPAILESRDRHTAKGVAPPHGLTLVAVSFDPNRFGSS
jgi:tRNA pseudouridine38-40 synthase